MKALFRVPWKWLLTKVRQHFGKQPVVLFDGMCSFCRASQRWTEILDPLRLVKWLPFQSPEAAVYGISTERLAKRMVALHHGREYEGFVAWKLVLVYHPCAWFLVWSTVMFNPWLLVLWVLLFLPVAEPIGHLAYDWIASNRYRLPGSTCEFPGHSPGK